MRLYRIVPRKYLENYSGKGKSHENGARWNLPGESVLYFGTSASVAMLEMGNYIPKPKMVPKSYALGVYETRSTAIETLALGDLPEGWDGFPYPSGTQAIGSDFLAGNRNLILLVPSCAAGGLDHIAVVNPNHTDIETLRLVDSKARIYNPRLFTSGLTNERR